MFTSSSVELSPISSPEQETLSDPELAAAAALFCCTVFT